MQDVQVVAVAEQVKQGDEQIPHWPKVSSDGININTCPLIQEVQLLTTIEHVAQGDAQAPQILLFMVVKARGDIQDVHCKSDPG